jgi:hypothetical protein
MHVVCGRTITGMRMRCDERYLSSGRANARWKRLACFCRAALARRPNRSMSTRPRSPPPSAAPRRPRNSPPAPSACRAFAQRACTHKRQRPRAKRTSPRLVIIDGSTPQEELTDLPLSSPQRLRCTLASRPQKARSRSAADIAHPRRSRSTLARGLIPLFASPSTDGTRFAARKSTKALSLGASCRLDGHSTRSGPERSV